MDTADVTPTCWATRSASHLNVPHSWARWSPPVPQSRLTAEHGHTPRWPLATNGRSARWRPGTRRLAAGASRVVSKYGRCVSAIESSRTVCGRTRAVRSTA